MVSRTRLPSLRRHPESSAWRFSPVGAFVTCFWRFLLLSIVGGVPCLSEGTRGRLGWRGRADRCLCPAQNHFPNFPRGRRGRHICEEEAEPALTGSERRPGCPRAQVRRRAARGTAMRTDRRGHGPYRTPHRGPRRLSAASLDSCRIPRRSGALSRACTARLDGQMVPDHGRPMATLGCPGRAAPCGLPPPSASWESPGPTGPSEVRLPRRPAGPSDLRPSQQRSRAGARLPASAS